MGISNVRWFVVVAVLLSVATAAGGRTDTNSAPGQSEQRPATVVVTVSNDSFHWADAGVGAAAGLATTLLALGFVLALRPDRGGRDHP